MTPPNIPKNELDDFHLTPEDHDSAATYYESFLTARTLAQQIPKSALASESGDVFYNFFKEVHQSKIALPALFRRTHDASYALSTLWLSKAKDAARTFLLFNEVIQFEGITKADLSAFAKLSVNVDHLPNLQQILFQRGIILIFEKSIPGMKLDGAAFQIHNSTPVIALSLRYPRLDIFWFSLMHELAHLALHFEQLATPILDDFDEITDDIIELQANRLAADSLVSRSDWRSCDALYNQNEETVIDFAKQVGVHPAIVAGRVRKELNRHNIFSKILNEVDVRKVLFHE